MRDSGGHGARACLPLGVGRHEVDVVDTAIAPARTLGSEKGPGSLSNGVRARVAVSRGVDRLVLSDAGDRDHHVIAGHAEDVDGEELVVGWPEHGAGRPGQLAVGWGIDVLNDDLDGNLSVAAEMYEKLGI